MSRLACRAGQRAACGGARGRARSPNGNRRPAEGGRQAAAGCGRPLTARGEGIDLKHRLEYLAVVSVTAVVGLLPWGAVRGLGNVLGFAFWAVDRTHRRITYSNLVRAFPLRSERECRALCRRVFLHFGRLTLELLKFSTLTSEEMLRLVEFEGDDRARQAYSSGHGVIFLTGHFGFWELNGIVHALKIAPIGVLARALDNPYLNAMLERLRQSTGNTVIYRKGAARRIMRALSANHGVALLIDQHVHG
ncbi:MAG: hypothetical protein EHM24_32590, partial [Acidobacteria bacterium]